MNKGLIEPIVKITGKASVWFFPREPDFMFFPQELTFHARNVQGKWIIYLNNRENGCFPQGGELISHLKKPLWLDSTKTEDARTELNWIELKE